MTLIDLLVVIVETNKLLEGLGGIVSLKPVVEALDGVKVGVDRTASELAIMRLKREILELERQRQDVSENLNWWFLYLVEWNLHTIRVSHYTFWFYVFIFSEDFNRVMPGIFSVWHWCSNRVAEISDYTSGKT